jgi:hypothetical protein
MAERMNGPTRPELRRRSRRVKAHIQVVVHRHQGQGRTETAGTLVVNAHGALILLAMPVVPGELISLKNVATEEEILARVTSLGTRLLGKTQVGIEFIKPEPNFWKVADRPENWERKQTLPVGAGSRKPAD